MIVPRRARELVLVAALLALPLLFLRANLTPSARLNWLDRLILRLSAPLQAGLTDGARALGGVWTRYLALVHVKADNARLLDENTRLRAALVTARAQAVRSGELERLLGVRGQLSAPRIAAEVIGVETSSLFRVVRLKLDRGADLVQPGMAVLASAGVVGRVERVFGSYCDVLLLTDPKSSIDVVVARTGGRGVLKGIAGAERYRTRIAYLERRDEVAVGDLVVTSGLAGIFPRDVPIGKVVKVTKKDFGLYQDAEVQPLVDFGKLRYVLVVAPQPPLLQSLAPGATP